MPQIELSKVCKTFTIRERPEGRFSVLRGMVKRTKREIKALQEIRFSIEEGELVGYIGPNGAGKSTTVKIMSGILTPESGSCPILGRVPWKERTSHVSQIGVVLGQRSQLWWDVPVIDSFELLRDIYGIDGRRYRIRLDELSQVLDLGALLKTPVRQLSLGQRMRCEVAAALLHSPGILFLDEPTIGLDAVSKLALREFLMRENREHGVTMIPTTHDMDDVEALCSRVMTIGHGRLLFDGTLHRVRATLERGAEYREITGTQRGMLQSRQYTAWFNAAQLPAQELVASLAAAYPLRDIVIEEEDIDHMIAAMYREMKL